MTPSLGTGLGAHAPPGDRDCGPGPESRRGPYYDRDRVRAHRLSYLVRGKFLNTLSHARP